MSEFSPQEWTMHNRAALEDLAWELETAAGQFALILARCNYLTLRQVLVEELQRICPLEIRVLVLQDWETALFARIRNTMGASLPGALMVFGLEQIDDLEQLLTTANQVREDFRKHCPFPIVIWLRDDDFRVLVQAAADLESWATKTYFTLPPEALQTGLQTAADRLFTALLNPAHHSIEDPLHPALDLGLLRPQEVAGAVQELASQGQGIDPILKASLDFGRGLSTKNPTEALAWFEQSQQFWQQSQQQSFQAELTPSLVLREALLLLYLGQCRYQLAEQAETQRLPDYPLPDWSWAQQPLQQCVEYFDQEQRPDLVAIALPHLERVLQKQQRWDDLEVSARWGINLHRVHGMRVRLSQDYGFLARACLERAQGQAAQSAAQQALAELTQEATDLPWLRGLYHLFAAQAARQLGNPVGAIAQLQKADAQAVSNCGYPKIAIRILHALRELYFEQGQYLAAFQVKQQRLSIEQQYGIRAFVGAGRLQPQRMPVVAEFAAPTEAMVAPEITAAGRQQDLERLIERIGRRDYRLTVLHGNSGVGKSSLVNAGLGPLLKRAIDERTNVPIVVRNYRQWLQELAGEMEKWGVRPESKGQGGDSKKPQGADIEKDGKKGGIEWLLEGLRELDQRNLRTVLVFDQFEEFFFVCPQTETRRSFFEFLAQCLQILSSNIVLVLREDYLHLLLECDRLPAMRQTGIDILSRAVRYELGNFLLADAQSIIQSLTKRSGFELELGLIKRLVADLAQELGTVRPIELQIVGAQLQAEHPPITTLAQYESLGTQPKEQLVERYLNGVVRDCGHQQNQNIAEIVLFLLTDEKGTRPLKTRVELVNELSTFGVIEDEVQSLDLVLKVLVGSGLVFLLPDAQESRYQLAHDYIAAFFRQQQEPRLTQLMAELEAEREKRQRAEDESRFNKQQLEKLEQASQVLEIANQKAKQRIRIGAGVLIFSSVVAMGALLAAGWASRQLKDASIGTQLEGDGAEALAKFREQEQTEALLLAVQAGKKLWLRVKDRGWTREQHVATGPVLALDTIIKGIRETRLEGHEGKVLSVVFSPNGTRLATIGTDNSARIWDLQGQQLAEIKGSFSNVVFSPDGKRLAASLSDGSAQILDLQGKRLAVIKGHHQGRVLSMVFSPDGTRLATFGTDNSARIWDLQGQQLVEYPMNHEDFLAMAFSSDGIRLVKRSPHVAVPLSIRFAIEVSSPHSNESNMVIDAVTSADAVFSSNGKRLAIKDKGKPIQVWDFSLGTKFTGSRSLDSASSMVFSLDGTQLVINQENGTTRIWDLQDNRVSEGAKGVVSSVVSKGKITWLAILDAKGAARIWNSENIEDTQNSDKGSDVYAAWKVDDLNTLLVHGCNKLRFYLQQKPGLSEEEKNLCYGIEEPK